MATALRDPIGFELFKNTLLSIADEMALTILRTAYSGVLRDNMDYSTAFCDGQGRTVAQGLTLPAHLSSFPDALAATLARFGDRMEPGDVYCLNDPFEGGMHIPDVFVLKPIFFEGERLAFAATICHQTDMGGRVAGSNASDSTEIYQEGLRIPPVKMYDQGEPNETLFRLFEKNVRVPVRVLGADVAEHAHRHAHVLLEQAEERLVRLALVVHLHGRDAQPLLIDLRRVGRIRSGDAPAHVGLVADGRREGEALALEEDRLQHEDVGDVHAAFEGIVQTVHVARLHAIPVARDRCGQGVGERREVGGQGKSLRDRPAAAVAEGRRVVHVVAQHARVRRAEDG